jgi:hypothetical protein
MNNDISERNSLLMIENNKLILEKGSMIKEFDMSVNNKNQGFEERLYELTNIVNNLTNELREKENMISELKMRVLDSNKNSFIVKSKRPDDLKTYLDISSDDHVTSNESYLKKVKGFFKLEREY